MGFLAGRMTFERFQLEESTRQFGEEHVQLLQKFAIGQVETASPDAPTIGFLAGKHLFDTDFSLEKNVIDSALHGALRIDTNKVDGPLQKAWLEMELAAMAAECDTGRVTRAQRQQAKETVKARCEEEIATGRFKRMAQTPFLWDAQEQTFYCGSAGTHEHFRSLFKEAFGLEFTRVTAGVLAEQIAAEQGWTKTLDNLTPARFGQNEAPETVAWLMQQPESADYLGNEFLLWLWWHLAEKAEEITLVDDTVVTAMLSKSLQLECPRGESGKESISADAPTRLPEALEAVQAGKLPRKTGITLVREGETYAFTLQAESLAVSGAAIEGEDSDKGRGALEERVAAIRRLSQTLDLLFETFCSRRLQRVWNEDLTQIQSWLQTDRRPKARRAG